MRRRVPSKDHVETTAFGRTAMAKPSGTGHGSDQGSVTFMIHKSKPTREPHQSTVLVRT